MMKNPFYRQPDFVIGDPTSPYLRRWWVIPRNRFFNIYLHHICRSDDDRALHDHPWASCSIILKGGYWEHTPDGRFWRKPGSVRFRRATAAHRLELSQESVFVTHAAYWTKQVERVTIRTPAWTLFITGPRVREWGFLCPKGWTHWRYFLGVKEGEIAKGHERGRGCDE
jgi:hypothetical protein